VALLPQHLGSQLCLESKQADAPPLDQKSFEQTLGWLSVESFVGNWSVAH
jgi:hypothetical protein